MKLRLLYNEEKVGYDGLKT